MAPDTSTQHFTIYLVKDSYTTFESVLRDASEVVSHEINIDGHDNGILFFRPSHSHMPKWAQLFSAVLPIDELQIMSSNAPALFLVQVQSRLFAIAFGHGRTLLNPSAFEERFGLKVTLNSIALNTVRSIDKKTFDSITRLSREQASREVTVAEFGLDIEMDLLRSVTGRPADSELGSRMVGRDGLAVTVPIQLNGLAGLLASYYEKYLDDSYKDDYPWVDHLAEVHDKSLITDLDARLIETFREREPENLWLAIPDLVDWSDVHGFKYSLSDRHPRLLDIDVNSFLSSLRNPNDINIHILKNHKVHCISATLDDSIEHWSVYNCANYETNLDGDTFILSGGKWYRVSTEFHDQINRAVRSVPTSELDLPRYNDRSEYEYNTRVHLEEPFIYALMDRNLIRYGGTGIEFCDLYTNTKKLIHVKRYAGSYVLSHLFAQAIVSADLFRADTRFREAVNSVLPDSHKLDSIENQVGFEEYGIVFAIIVRPTFVALPFFSKITLHHSVRRLRGIGFGVALNFIQVGR